MHYYSLGFFIFGIVASVELFFRFRGRDFQFYRVLAAAAFVCMLATAIHFNFFRGSPWVNSDYIGKSWFPEGDSIDITMAVRTQDRLVVEGHYNLVSASSAMLALGIDLTNTPTNSEVLPSPLQRMRISGGRGDFKLIHPHLAPGLPYVSMSADGRQFAALYFGTKSEAMEESKGKMVQAAPAAGSSAGDWYLYREESQPKIKQMPAAQPAASNVLVAPAAGGLAMERNRDVIRAKIHQAELEAAQQKTLYNAGLGSPTDLDAAQAKVEILKAELDGDDVKVAQVRLAAAQRTWRLLSQQARAGFVSGPDVAVAQAEVEVREAELKAAQAAAGRGTNSPR